MWSARACLEPRPVSFLRHHPETHDRRQQVERRGHLGQGHRHRMKAVDRVLGVDRRIGPRGPTIVGCLSHELDLDAVGVVQDDGVGVKPADHPVIYTQPLEPVAPETKGSGRHLERDCRDLAAAGALLRPGRPAEERHGRPRGAQVIAEIDVVGVRQVLVDALLDEAEPKHSDVEVDALLHVAGDARHVVDTGNAGGHFPSGQIVGRTLILVPLFSGVSRGVRLGP